MPFPPRTPITDACANAIHAHLTTAGVGVGGNNKMMICVVTAGGTAALPTHIFIAFSGAAAGGGVRAALTNLHTNAAFIGIQPAIQAPFAGAGQLTGQPAAAGGHGGLAAAPGGFQLANARHCAEPKAILAAAAVGLRPNGMSTIWWGNTDNAYPDPVNNAAGIFAVPCEICALNEEWICARAGVQRDVARGQPRRAFESPI